MWINIRGARADDVHVQPLARLLVDQQLEHAALAAQKLMSRGEQHQAPATSTVVV
jgi:hypothetical protein